MSLLLSLLFDFRGLAGAIRMVRETLGLQENGAHPIEGELLSSHPVIVKEAHGGEGSCTQHTYPGQQL